MKILAIETSCDDTGIAILEVKSLKESASFKILSNKVHTQLIHSEYGGVFPMVAKREHGKNIVPTILASLKEAHLLSKKKSVKINPKIEKAIRKILERENDLADIFLEEIATIKKPSLDSIAVTVGPGLEPALWVGISMARALSLLWDIPIIPVNHMEGHILSVLVKKDKTFTYTKDTLEFPVLSLLISGGHTEIVLVKEFGLYKIIGQTRDDACGEAFDKVARMLGLPYPGGPEISKLAKEERSAERESDSLDKDFPRSGRDISKLKKSNGEEIRGPEKSSSELKPLILPRPMMYSKDYDFSFSGLKTAVLYMIRDLPEGRLTDDIKSKIAKEFENAVVDVLVAKTFRAVQEHAIKTIIIGGGVSGNTHLQSILKQKIKEYSKEITLHFPTKALSTDNALMIAIAGYFQSPKKKIKPKNKKLIAQGNLSL